MGVEQAHQGRGDGAQVGAARGLGGAIGGAMLSRGALLLDQGGDVGGPGPLRPTGGPDE